MSTEESSSAITGLLRDYSNGLSGALDSAVALVYAELQQLARAQLRRSSVRQQHIDTTVLVHEAYEKLVLGQTQDIQDSRHFFAIASRAMRQIVVDSYRAQQTQKRGGDAVSLTLTEADILDLSGPERVFAANAAIEKLAQHDQELAQIIDMVCFAGLSNHEIATALNQNVRSVQRKLKRAQAWLGVYLEA